MQICSPDHRTTLHFAIKPVKGASSGDGQLVYSIDFRGKRMFEDSSLGIELARKPTLGAAVHIASSTPGSGVDQYRLLTGKKSDVHDAYNNLVVAVAESANPGRKFSVEARVYNDAQLS